MRFKKGDELIIVKDLSERGSFGEVVGEKFTVTHVDSIYYWGNGDKTLMVEEEVELAAIYNSPLYKALR